MHSAWGLTRSKPFRGLPALEKYSSIFLGACAWRRHDGTGRPRGTSDHEPGRTYEKRGYMNWLSKRSLLAVLAVTFIVGCGDEDEEGCTDAEVEEAVARCQRCIDSCSSCTDPGASCTASCRGCDE